MPEPEVYEPSGELQSRLEEEGQIRHEQAQEAANANGPKKSDDGLEVVDYEGPKKVHLRFTRSQIAAMDSETYNKHRDEIVYASLNGNIEDDVTSDETRAKQEAFKHRVADAVAHQDQRITLPAMVREAEKVVELKYAAYKQAQDKHDSEVASDDPRVRMVRFQVVQERRVAWNDAVTRRDELKQQLTDMRLGRKPKETQ